MVAQEVPLRDVGVDDGRKIRGVVGDMADVFRKGSGVPRDGRLAVIVTNFLAGWASQIRREQRMGRWGTLDLELNLELGLGLGLGLAGVVGPSRLGGGGTWRGGGYRGHGCVGRPHGFGCSLAGGLSPGPGALDGRCQSEAEAPDQPSCCLVLPGREGLGDVGFCEGPATLARGAGGVEGGGNGWWHVGVDFGVGVVDINVGGVDGGRRIFRVGLDEGVVVVVRQGGRCRRCSA